MWYLIVSIPDLCTLTYFCKKKHQNQKCKSKRDCIQHTCAPSAGICCPHLGPSYKQKYSSLKKSNTELPGGPPVITITGQVWQQCFKAEDGRHLNKDRQTRVHAYFTRLCMALWQCHCQFILNKPIDYPSTATQ